MSLPPPREPRGCLSEAALAQLAQAPPGRAPAELAAHLAGCARCQARLLARDARDGAPRAKKAPPPPWRLWAALAAVALLTVVALVAGRLLAAR